MYLAGRCRAPLRLVFQRNRNTQHSLLRTRHFYSGPVVLALERCCSSCCLPLACRYKYRPSEFLAVYGSVAPSFGTELPVESLNTPPFEDLCERCTGFLIPA